MCLAGIAAPPGHAAEEANPACGMTICLSTDNLQAGGVACAMSLKEFFKIKVKKAGVVNVPKTIRKREKKLKSCEGARSSDIAQIMARYGALIDPL